jgi:hypothetical protein
MRFRRSGYQGDRQIAKVDLTDWLQARQEKRWGSAEPQKGVPKFETGSAARQQDQVIGQAFNRLAEQSHREARQKRPLGRDR